MGRINRLSETQTLVAPTEIDALSEPTQEQLDEPLDPSAPALFLDLLDGEEAKFRTPTVFDLRRAETVEGAITNNQFQPAYFVELGRLTCLDWGGSPSMPSGKALDAQDYQEVVLLFTEYSQHWTEQAEMAGYEVGEDGSHEVELRDGQVLVFRRLTAEDMERAGKIKGGNAEINARLASAACTSWAGESISWAIVYQRIGSLDVPNYMRIMNTLSKFFRGDSRRPRRRRFL
jgi:hypothetical protein